MSGQLESHFLHFLFLGLDISHEQPAGRSVEKVPWAVIVSKSAAFFSDVVRWNSIIGILVFSSKDENTKDPNPNPDYCLQGNLARNKNKHVTKFMFLKYFLGMSQSGFFFTSIPESFNI